MVKRMALMSALLLAGGVNADQPFFKEGHIESEKKVAGNQDSLLDDLDIIGCEYRDDTCPIKNDWLTGALDSLHRSAAEKARLHFFVEQAYRHSWVGNAPEGQGTNHDWYKIHAHVGVNFVQSTEHQGTWLKVEFSGATPLNGRTRQAGSLDAMFGASGPTDCDVFEGDFFYFPEILLSQGFGKNDGVVMIGVINQTNYFDTNSYANTTYGQFTSAPFVNNQVLPLADANLGVIVQKQLSSSFYVQMGASMMDSGPRRNPFRHSSGKAFNVVGEAGWVADDVAGMGEGAYRLQPFLFRNGGETEGGIGLDIEQSLGNSPFAVYARAGWSSAESGNIGGACAQGSAGLILKKPLTCLFGCEESDANFLGIGLAVSKPDGDTLAEGRSTHQREKVLECVYTYAITRYFLIQPSFQFVKNPAGRIDEENGHIFSIQTVLSF